MKIASVLATTVLAIGFSMTGIAIPSAYAADAASVTCADFTAMSSADQEAAFESVKAAIPPTTLAKGDSTHETGQSAANNDKTMTPSVGMLVSACQAAGPTSTVMAAVQQAMGGNVTTSTTTTN